MSEELIMFLKASIILDISPPEAILYRGFSGSPRLADIKISTDNKSVKEIDIFKKISNEKYKDFIIYQRGYGVYHYIFKGVKRYSISMHVLRNGKTWNNTDNVEYYEISEETFEGISKLYDELFKKCEH